MDPLITLTTDFGTRDPFVAAMKGVLLRECPGVRMLDLSHEIAAHDVLEGALFVAAALPYFPPATVHVVVVDPGVGTARRALAAECAGQRVVCPDNGLLTMLERTHPLTALHALDAPPAGAAISATFHGRDIFAPAAARLACGRGSVADAGPPVADPVRLALPAVEARADGTLIATVIHIDRFGNAITNAGAASLPARGQCRAAGRSVPLVRTYADVPVGAPLALIGSAGLLEVAVHRGRAADELPLARGDQVTVIPG